MADNPIQFNDLVSESAIEGLQRLIDTIDKLLQQMDGLKSATQQSAQAYTQQVQAIQTDTAAMAEMAVKVATLERGYEDLQKVYEKLKSDKKQLAEEQRKYKKLTAEEAESVRHLTATVDEYIRLTNSENKSLKWLADAYGKNIVEIDMQKKSYNELYATYNALKDALNKMTIEQRTNTEAGKRMTEQALKIRDTLNELQKSTGNYTLQVGKYRAAFDGLGYSFQQILREAPSALNLNQFFLAISNNIPMFLDQLKAFKTEQEAIKANLDQMTKGTKEYEEQLGKVESVGKKLSRTLLSWQTGVLVLLMIIRKIDWNKLWNNLKKTFVGVKEIKNEISSAVALAQLFSEVTKKVADEAVELDLVIDRLKKVKQGSDEWRAGVATVNKLTKENLDTTTATIGEVEKVTEAYKKQAEQVAKNGILADMIAKSEANKILRESGYSAQDIGSLGMLLGIKADSKDYKKMEDVFKKYAELRDKYINYTTNPDAKVYKTVGTSSAGTAQNITLSAAEAAKDIEPFLHKAEQELDNFINQRLPILSDKAKKDLEEQFKLIDPLKTSGGRGRSYSLKDVDFLESELLDKDAVIELENGFKRRLAMLDEQEEKERLILKEKYERELGDLKYNKERKLITEKEYDEQLAKLNKNYNDLIKKDYTGNFEEMGVIQRKYWNKRNEISAKEAEKEENEAQKRDKKKLDEMDARYNKEMVAIRRRTRTIRDEIQKNSALVQNIDVLTRKYNELSTATFESNKEAEENCKRMEEVRQQIAKLQTQIDHTRELKGRDLKTILFEGIQGGVGNGTKQSILESILGKDAYKAFENDSEKLQEAVESDFETWLNTTADAVKEWYSTTLGYIQDLMQAYIDLANAKAEAAAEETEAAKEQYEKEKALMEAGYANRMETAWAEYQEKKDLQKKAEADAKQAERNQEMLNSAMQASEIATAVAKIYAQFANSPWGIALATALSATMVAAFVAAKSKAIEATRYGDGTAELIQGGSHASGHDVSLAYDSKGRERRVEGGEVFGVINRRAVRRYGADNVMSLINSLNRGTYEGHATRLMAMQNELSGGAGKAVVSSKTDLRRVESGIDKLVGYSQHRTYTEADGTVVEQHPNGTVRYLKH